MFACDAATEITLCFVLVDAVISIEIKVKSPDEDTSFNGNCSNLKFLPMKRFRLTYHCAFRTQEKSHNRNMRNYKYLKRGSHYFPPYQRLEFFGAGMNWLKANLLSVHREICHFV